MFILCIFIFFIKMGKLSLEVIFIKEVEKAYIAGIINGKGCIMPQRFHKAISLKVIIFS